MKFRLLFVLWFGSALLLRAVDVSAPMTTNVVAPYILTPPAPATPRINGASVFGVRPGSPFLYTIPATGERPMEFSIEGIPDGLIIVTNGIDPTIKRRPHGVLKLNPVTGQITGSITGKGEYKIVLVAKNSQGEARKNFRIVVGDQIALTPPMGWNSWNCFAHAVSQDKVKSAADAMVKSGLNNHGAISMWTITGRTIAVRMRLHLVNYGMQTIRRCAVPSAMRRGSSCPTRGSQT